MKTEAGICAVKVIRRPYMFVYRSERDHQELDVINVASALIEFSEETTSMIRVCSLFNSVLVLLLCSHVSLSMTV